MNMKKKSKKIQTFYIIFTSFLEIFKNLFTSKRFLYELLIILKDNFDKKMIKVKKE